ncbi:4Fe-4S single cluster domain-containing protein [Desulforhabdus sp. TSK]|uniref:4Fe-4S single cluster domain-containing protein n=1 Tax=Desulforhabdus sp. TSK TaxID=2925014 RepID=UPI001FC8341B|nr:4Fe-4S single cluster domain-containing protein [Desulforhabdus sp. TSK]GKT09132.1 hypothetical protein DSTSK_24370 [Desulforhabdus sp. TSK]
MKGVDINIYGIAHPVRCLGPGCRLVLWVAGCYRRCEGCASPTLQDPAAGKLIPVDHLARRILAIRLPLDGITLTGGEPVDQAQALTGLLDRLRAERPEWSTILYSGYTLEEIQGKGGAEGRLLDLTDILVDGPFERHIPACHPLAGSGNQKVHCLSSRGRQLKRRADEVLATNFELGIGPDSTHLLIGIGAQRERTAVKTALSRLNELNKRLEGRRLL